MAITQKEIKTLIQAMEGRFVTKEELKGEIDGLDQKFTIKFDEVLTGQDKLIKMFEDWHIENIAGKAQIQRLEKKDEELDHRVSILESKVN